MAIAKVNFYWKGVLIQAGKDAPDDAPSSLVVQSDNEVVKPREKVRKRMSTKNGAPKDLENK
jgi:hypothetical protein